MSAPDANPDLLTPAEAEAYTRVPKAHLAQLRHKGTGPKFLKPSARVVLYRRADLDAWLEASEYQGTSEYAR